MSIVMQLIETSIWLFDEQQGPPSQGNTMNPSCPHCNSAVNQKSTHCSHCGHEITFIDDTFAASTSSSSAIESHTLNAHRHMRIPKFFRKAFQSKKTFWLTVIVFIVVAGTTIGLTTHLVQRVIHHANDPETKILSSRIASKYESKYQYAVQHYREKDYNAAFNVLRRMPSYKDTRKYTYLLTVHYLNGTMGMKPHTLFKSQTGAFFDRYDSHALYSNIVSLGDFEDAQELMTSDYLISYYLEGSWKVGDYILRVEQYDVSTAHDRDFHRKHFSFDCNLPYPDGNKYRIHQQIISYGDDETDWTKAYRIEYVDHNTIAVYVYATDETYTMTRAR